MILLSEVKPTPIYQEVADRIEEAILAGEIKAGERLPSERQLTEMLKTSRRTLREGLRLLEERGMISVRVGSKGGVFVKEMGFERVRNSLAHLIRLKKVSLGELAEFRVDVEGIVAARAAERATEKEISELRELVKEAQALTSQKRLDRQAILDLDRRMHIFLSRISGNLLYENVLTTIHDNIGKYYEHYLPVSRKILIDNCNDLKALFEAVRKRDAQSARRIATKHAEKGLNYMGLDSTGSEPPV